MPAQKVKAAPKGTGTATLPRPRPRRPDGRSKGPDHAVVTVSTDGTGAHDALEELEVRAATFLGEPTPTGTGTPVVTPTGTGTPVVTPTGTGTPVGTPTGTGTPVVTPTGTGTPTPTGTPSGTGTGTGVEEPGGVVLEREERFRQAPFREEEEAPLDRILAQRTATWTSDEDEEVTAPRLRRQLELDDEPTVIAPRQPDEFVCAACFLVKRRELLADPAHRFCRDCAA